MEKVITSPPMWDGVLFSIDFFVYFFISKITTRRLDWTDLHEFFREGVE